MKTKKFIILMVIVLFFMDGLFVLAEEERDSQAQTEQKRKKEGDKQESKNTPLFKSILQDEGTILTSPFRMKGKDFLTVGGVVLVTGVLIASDESTFRHIKEYKDKHKWVRDFGRNVTKLGLGEWNLGIAGAFYLGGLLFKDKRAQETARLTFMTFIHTAVVVQIGKHLAGRQRPSWDNGNDHWAGPAGFFNRYESGQMAHYDAFPSGHTITVFGTATVISEMYKNTVWVPILSYSLATMCGLSRITEETHWLSDVFVGAVLGYAIGKYVVKKRNRLGGRGLNVYPVATTHQIGLGMQYIF